ncbi:hypothetical protein TNIN_242931 [Trichonephila inaurata madagascariensis]|uniref:Uncharacterized protein n=1 Tax=Trichonephila inaurata madagascariensis TaxID=2747483 RepID=A0A8X6XDP3_9ARAC|nr:hypothetical protein TNIN_242931 [Trichonephila inaurata madagascariensis]
MANVEASFEFRPTWSRWHTNPDSLNTLSNVEFEVELRHDQRSTKFYTSLPSSIVRLQLVNWNCASKSSRDMMRKFWTTVAN